jgi:hypothetical protein
MNLLDAGKSKIGVEDITEILVDEAGDLERYGAQVINCVGKGLDRVFLEIAHHPNDRNLI